MKCRHCKQPLVHTFLDLGFAPPSNAYLSVEQLEQPEVYYPLKLKVCANCWLVQTIDYTQANDLFCDDYAYFSSTSTAWLKHAAAFCEAITKRLSIDANSHVIEIASNDGYLLKNFVANGISCLGIEPTRDTAEAAERLGIPVWREFFGTALANRIVSSGKQADLLIGNNVFAHVPDINDFTEGMRLALKCCGTITLEFPHLMSLIDQNQFDTVYHEHFSYLSLFTVCKIFESHGLRVFDVEELPTHGGSIRVYGCHFSDARPTCSKVSSMLQEEEHAGLREIATYSNFQDRADKVKNDLLDFLISQKRANKKVFAYGAAAKGNTLLNYAGVKPDLLPKVADAAPSKQGKFCPGSHIPVVSPADLHKQAIDYLIVLPWNLFDEVAASLLSLKKSGTQLVTCVPSIRIH